MPSGELRRRLRAAGHTLAPVVQIGKLGATEAIDKQVTRALLDHELIKVKLGSESPQTRFELAERFVAMPGVQVAQILGRTLLLYRRHPKHPRFEKTATPDVKARPAQRAQPGAVAEQSEAEWRVSRPKVLASRPAGEPARKSSAPTARLPRKP